MTNARSADAEVVPTSKKGTGGLQTAQGGTCEHVDRGDADMLQSLPGEEGLDDNQTTCAEVESDLKAVACHAAALLVQLQKPSTSSPGVAPFP